jgi:hypothetical protein
MTTEVSNNNNNEDYFPVTSDISSSNSDIDMLEVIKALESVGFRLIDHEN